MGPYPMSDAENSTVMESLSHDFLHSLVGLGVKAARGFIQNEHLTSAVLLLRHR